MRALCGKYRLARSLALRSRRVRPAFLFLLPCVSLLSKGECARKATEPIFQIRQRLTVVAGKFGSVKLQGWLEA